MCVAMVIIYKKTLEKKAVDDVTSKQPDFGPFQAQTMSQGTTLFSCGLMERSPWHEGAPGCAMQQRPVGASLDSLWDVLPEVHAGPARWELGATSGAITSLLQDLSLAEAAASASAAPPSKRQCRSLSCSDEPGAWRPQGSRVWTAVEKRRCHSGSSVQRGSAAAVQAGFPAMQRSSSFSLPARCNAPEPPSSSQRLPRPPAFTGPAHPASPPAQPLYLSHEQICLPEPRGPSPPSSADSTPEVERRGGQGGLARSRSQPCVLNDKKVGMKRRRPDDHHKPRPSLDLAKMTQKLRNFHSLSCPGIPGEDSQSNQALPILRNGSQCEADFAPVSEEGSKDIPPRTKESRVTRSLGMDPTIEELQLSSPDVGDVTAGTTNGKDREPLWAGLCSTRKDVYQLGGELDIEQIERN